MVLATVKGDVHDIGKNLVDIILTNNGYTVKNLGIKVGITDMVAALTQVGEVFGPRRSGIGKRLKRSGSPRPQHHREALLDDSPGHRAALVAKSDEAHCLDARHE